MTRRPSRVAVAAAVLQIGIAAFQVALALGAPWGRASYGGVHAGVLPTEFRVASAISVPVHLAFAAVALGALVPGRGRRPALWGLTGFAALACLVNAATPSPVERAIWAPVTATLTVLFALLARREGRSGDRVAARATR
ncbi:MAG: hypothetical protein ACFCVG_12760 [Kineosporiaceae bacterium]